jgi:hypothetical protein
MKRILSVYFNIDRVYLTLFEITEKGLKLHYVNSTEAPLDLENPEDDASVLTMQELEILIQEAGAADYLCVSLPAESVLISHIPGDLSMEEHRLKQLVGLEIRQAFPQFNFQDFSPLVVELGERMDGKKMLCAQIIPNKIIATVKQALAPAGIPISRYDASQFNSHSALLYNYPEQKDKAAALVSVQKQFVDLSVVKNGVPIYYSLVNFNSPDDIGPICESEFNKIMTDYVDYVETAFFCGVGLTTEIYQKAEAKLAEFLMTSVRLNAFKMVSSELEQREKEYCSRTAHIYPACVGAAIPPYHKSLYLDSCE